MTRPIRFRPGFLVAFCLAVFLQPMTLASAKDSAGWSCGSWTKDSSGKCTATRVCTRVVCPIIGNKISTTCGKETRKECAKNDDGGSKSSGVQSRLRDLGYNLDYDSGRVVSNTPSTTPRTSHTPSGGLAAPKVSTLSLGLRPRPTRPSAGSKTSPPTKNTPSLPRPNPGTGSDSGSTYPSAPFDPAEVKFPSPTKGKSTNRPSSRREVLPERPVVRQPGVTSPGVNLSGRDRRLGREDLEVINPDIFTDGGPTPPEVVNPGI